MVLAHSVTHGVIPAKAGISVWADTLLTRNGDSRFRGNDPVIGMQSLSEGATS